jgi:hypothetical protein
VGVQRTNTHDDVHDGMVVHIGPPVTEHSCEYWWRCVVNSLH